MTTRKSGSRRLGKTNASGNAGLRNSFRDKGRLREKRRRQDRRSLLETLEQRQLLAGPQLVGIQPNEGSLLIDGTELNTAPRELVFQFDDATLIDPASLAGIQITRAGDDNVFESAEATSDLGTGGTVLVQFRAVEPGIRGNGIRLEFTTRSRTDTSIPQISVAGQTVSIELNSNPSRATTVRDLVQGLATDSEASALVSAIQVSGASQTRIGETVPSGTEVVLTGANAAQAFTDLGTENAIRVRVLAVAPGAAGRGQQLIVEQRDFGGPALPIVLTEENNVRVLVNSSPGDETTAQELIDAINSNPQAGELLELQLESGDGETVIGNRTPFYSPLTLTGASDVTVEPGFVGLGDAPNQVVFRFAEPLPDDTYRIDILGSGTSALQNQVGEAFGDGVNLSRQFEINLGPQVVAVVPEPVRRLADGSLSPDVGVIEVHFNNDELARRRPVDPNNPGGPTESVAENRDFYQLFYSRNTANGDDDVRITPVSVSYNATTNVARLQFANPLARVPDPNNPNQFLTGGARLRIGSEDILPAAPTVINLGTGSPDPGDQFSTAFDLNSQINLSAGGTQSTIVSSEILNESRYGLQFPGGPDMPGVRQIRPEDPTRISRTVPLDYLRRGADDADGISRVFYDFASSWLGDNPTTPGIDNDTTYFNVITEEQKQRVREVLSLFSEYLGIQFVETNGGPAGDAFFTIAVGDLHGADPAATSGPGGLAVATGDRNGDGFNDIGVLDFQDFDASTDDLFGGEFFRGAMLLVGQMLGYGFADDLPQPVTQSTLSVFNPGGVNEPTFPSAADIVNGQFLYRPESLDIDLYRFELDKSGTVSIQTIAERLSEASLLDTALRLYRQHDDGGFEEIAANDDYFSSDSLIEMKLAAGTYVVGVSASGNTDYDPAISETGMGGRTEGAYDLRIEFRANGTAGLTDTTGVPLDGDNDGSPGGIFNFWFAPSDPTATLYVDKAAGSAGNGTINNPFANLGDAIGQARPGQTVRVVANGGVDGLVETTEDNFSYQIGIDSFGNPLQDGETLDVPRGVTLVMDAGVIVKMRRSHVGVGSTSPTIDRSGSALQLLGTPTLRDNNGQLIRDANNEIVPGSVYFTSFNDDTIGTGNTPAFTPDAEAGDWGGLDFRGDLDAADQSRVNLEDFGLFLNHVQFADLRYGGGSVSINGRSTVVSPVEMATTRATVMHSRITDSANAAISATPDTFTETRFDEPVFQAEAPFTPDYRRVGPDIHHNFIVDNSINGLFVRVVTRSGESVQPLTTQARFDDTDIPHILTENLIIQGKPGGALLDSQAPSTLLVRLAANPTGNVPAGTYTYKLTNVDASGQESPASASTPSVTLSNSGSINLSQLPRTPAGGEFVGRRLYRATLTTDPVTGELVEGPFRLVASLNSSSTSFTDNNADPGAPLVGGDAVFRARLDARLAIDPGTTIKLDSARIEVQFGGQLLAEGTEGLPVVFTSLEDQRYGGSGTFDTNSRGSNFEVTPGAWGGIYVGHTSKASLDHAVIAGAGGVTRIEGGFASFNPIEIHQAQVRVANSVFEMNADGRSEPAGDRAGRMANAPGTIFVRGATPIIVGNQMTGGEGAAVTVDVNSLSSFAVNDWGRSRGEIDRVDSQGNAGPLIRDNALGNNEINGLHVRGGELATEGVWDDTDIVHVVTSTIEVPNQFVYGGLRLESDARNSLVVKFENRDEPAAIVVGGTLLTAEEQLRDIPDRIGGALQIVGHPDFPVVLTSLKDDSAGAGFDPQGRPQVDTNNDGIFGSAAGPQAPTEFVVLPTGPAVDNGTLIDNDVARTTPGFFEAQPTAGGELRFGSTAATVNAASTGQTLVAQNLIFQFSNYIIVGGATQMLANTTITQQPTLVADDRVESRGTFAGDNGDVDWIATTYFRDGVAVMFNEISFESSEPLGDIRFVNFHHQDVLGTPANDFLYTRGTPGQADFRAVIVNTDDRVGFAHGGFYENGLNQENASYAGWTADIFPALETDIEANVANYTIPGVIDAAALGTGTDPTLGPTFGTADVNTAFAWDVNATANSSRITSFLELLWSDPAEGLASPPSAGDWTGIVVREAASDRNVAAISEAEHDGALMPGTNSIPGNAQFLGELAPDEVSGDENRRLGFVVNGDIAHRSDVDVYSFVAESGTQVWLDIDRTSLSLDSVVELIDANGEILALSDDSLAEERDPSRLIVSDRLDADSVRPMAEIGERTETQQITVSENIVEASGFLTIGLEGSDDTVRIRVADFVADPAGSVRLAIASQFGAVLGPVDVSLVRRDARQVAPNDPSNVLVPGDDFVLEVRFRHALYLGSDVPDLQFTTTDLSVPGGGQVDIGFEEVIDESQLQDRYSINPRDAGMRIVLPGETGTRNLYHVRVRSSNVSPDASDTERDSRLKDPSLVRAGLTSGEYQLQIRLREADEFPGTQVRFADVRYATNGIQVIGQPFHSPLLGEEYEQAGSNDVFADAQPLGPFGVNADGSATNNGPLNSDLLAKSVAGRLENATDIDWYQFDVQYENLTRDAARMFMSTIFDLDYADNFARADMALYVFDESGNLIMVGGDSNIADDQPRSGQGADSADLSRGSAGTLDPYIGATELSEGSYFVAVANQSQIPLPMDQFYNANSANPLFRLEPIDSVVRIAEDRIGSSGGGTAAAPQVPVLFDPSTAPVPLALNDLIVYTIGTTGNGVEQTIQLINPFTGERYGEVGTPNQDIADFAFLPNGELFGYSRDLLTGASDDDGWEYFRISSEDGTLTNLGPTSMQTFHVEIDDNGNPQVVVSDDGVHPEAITFRDNSLGFFVGNRPFARPGPDYFQNILYQFDPQTGEPFSGPRGDREVRTVGGVDIDERADGAGTQIRERGFIETREVDSAGNVLDPQTTPRSQLIFPEATSVASDGTTTAIVNDGDQFTVTLSNGQQATFEMNSGPTYTFEHNAANGVSVRDGDLITVTSANGTRVYEFNTGPVLVLDSAAISDGSRVTLTDQSGVSRTFEFDSNGTLSDPDAFRVPMLDADGDPLAEQAQVDALISAITAADFDLVATASQGAELGRIQLSRDSETTPPTVVGSGMTVEGDHDVRPGNQNTQIRVEETATRAEFAAAISRTVGNGVVVGFEGNRIHFRGATGADVTSLQQRGIITATTGAGGVSSGAVSVPFSVSDRAEDLATRAAVAINNASLANTTASASGRVLTLTNGSVQQNQVDSVFQIPDLAPGGRVTGIAFIGNVLFAVSDQGGLYRVNNPTATIEGAIGDYVGTATDLLGIPFTGLSTGPPEVEGGRFADLLFGTTAAGRVYAFNTAGELQPVFSGGRTNIDVNGSGGVRGIQFSTLDYNLWHTTQNRGTDPGHGYSENFSNTRLQNFSRIFGGTSFYFGYEDSGFGNLTTPAQDPLGVARQDGQPVENTYNFPGGAHGTLESNPFGLAGYSAEDQPYLYFNYFLETDNADGLNNLPQQANADLDAFRVYVITDDGVEHLVATNNSARGPGFADDEFDDPTNSFRFRDAYDDDIDVDTQELFDNTDSWRQARVALGEFAGQENLRLRIDFSTAGQINRDDIGLRTQPGSKLQDGQEIVIGGETFELVMGPTVVLPPGRSIADFYAAADAGNPGSAPDTRVTLRVAGTTFVLNDGLRNVDTQAGEIDVPLSDPADPNTKPLAELSAAEVTNILSQALEANRPPTTTDDAFDFGVENNNELAQATPLPEVAGDLSLSGTGELQDVRDVDLFQLDALTGTVIEASAAQQTGSAVNPRVRLFDSEGNQLAISSGTAGIQFTVPRDGTYYIGFSSNANPNYNPVVAGSGSDGDIGTYEATIEITRDFRVLINQNRIEITGGFDVTTPANSPLTVDGTPGSEGIPVQVDSGMTAAEVAAVLRDAIGRRFAEGEQDVYPVNGSKIHLVGLTIEDAGPFDATGLRWGDNFGTKSARRAQDNAFEGLYVDDFIIGFAERGELATNASGDTTFITDPSPNLTSPPQPVSDLVTGSYQLEIRDASEYVASQVSDQFRAFDTNDRLAASQTITARPAAELVDGATFTIGDGNASVTFEFDLVEANSGVSAGNVRIPYTFRQIQPGSEQIDPQTGEPIPGTGVARPQSASGVAEAIVAAINSNEVQRVLNVSALLSSGIDATNDSRINLFGTSLIEDPSGTLASVERSDERGDKNRDRGAQGMILIENSRFIFSEQFGVDLVHDTTAEVAGNTTSNLVRYPRNLVELNTEQLAPGVVVQSNVLAYNGAGGIQITGIGAGQAAANPVPFDRIVNNTIIGGSIQPGSPATADTFQGIMFDLGTTAFADQVVSYSPNAGGGPQPDAAFRNPTTALGPPQLDGRGAEPTDGQSTVSLGNGGVLVLAFTDNLLTGSGNSLPDLAIFEAGAVESVRVEISRDGSVFHNVGIVGGATNVIDIDAAGFGPEDRFAFVRLTDLRQGTPGSSTIGADIDAVGAISSIATDRFTAGGVGVTIRQNATPTLLNNVVANSETGVSIDASSSSSVLGGTTFYRNTDDTSPGVALGQFPQQLADAEQVFVGAGELIFTPAAGSSIIDSSINSLQDRSSLVTVRSPLGLPPSPIIAPAFDVNGQLRVDDPNVESPFGSGETVFKDRGAADRADTSGPRAILVSPRAAELGSGAGEARVIGRAPQAFEIQLIDGIAPSDPTPGVGVDDRSVSSEAILLLKDGVPQVEGVDYRFGYNPSTNTIRLTALAGVFERNSVYVVRLLDSSDAVIRSVAGTQLTDGTVFNVIDRQGELTRFEYETGIRMALPTINDSTDPDGLTFAISDGPLEVTFELDTDGATTGGNVPITFTPQTTVEDVLALIASTINDTALQVTATALPNGEIGLMGTRPLTSVDPLDSGATVTGAIGTSVGFGIGIPNNGLLADDIEDGQSFTISRGALQEVTFEFDTNGTLTNPDAVRVDISGALTLNQVADALVRSVGGSGLGLNPVNAGSGRVVLNANANYSLDVTDSNLDQLGFPGESATVPVVIPPASTAQEVAEIIGQTIDDASLPGVNTSVVDTRVFVNGTRGVTGAGAVNLVTIQDTAGNRLQSNQANGRTELTIFVGAGFDYGDAPAPYPSLLADNGPRHEIDPGLTFGGDVTADADARLPNADSDVGVSFRGSVRAGFNATLEVEVHSENVDPSFILDVWVDWNGNGEFEGNRNVAHNEYRRFASSILIPQGSVFRGELPLAVPADAVGTTYARVRLSSGGTVAPIGPAPDGEVIDLPLTITANPFRNPDPELRADVNDSDAVTPLDALLIINAMNRAGQTSIPLSPPPNVSLPTYPDVNGDGFVNASDALGVIRELNRIHNSGSGEGEGESTAYVPSSQGVMASVPTALGELPPAAIPPLKTDSTAEGEQVPQNQPEILSPQTAKASSFGSTSVFDSADTIALDEILESLADRPSESTGDSEQDNLDAVFADFGR